MDTPPTEAPSPLEAAINSTLQTSEQAPGRDLLSDFTDELTKDLPVEIPGETAPKTEDEDPPELREEKPKVEEEKPKTDDEKIPEPPEKMAAKTRESWDALRKRGDDHKAAAEAKAAEIQTHVAENQTLKARLAELETKAAKASEYEAQMAQFKEMESELAVHRIESTPEYKKAITEPFKAITSAVEVLVKGNEGTDPEAVFHMIEEADPAKQRAMLKDLTTGWDDIDRNDLRDMVRDARVLFDKQSEMKTNAHAAAKERETLAAQSETVAKEKARAEMKAASGDVIKDLKLKVPFIPLADGETQEDRYTNLQSKLDQVDFDSQSPRGKAFAAAVALEYPNMIRMMAKQAETIAALEARVGKENKAKPGTESKEPVVLKKQAGDDDNLFDFESPASKFAESLAKAGG